MNVNVNVHWKIAYPVLEWVPAWLRVVQRYGIDWKHHFTQEVVSTKHVGMPHGEP